jgi:hypothetical protein
MIIGSSVESTRDCWNDDASVHPIDHGHLLRIYTGLKRLWCIFNFENVMNRRLIIFLRIAIDHSPLLALAYFLQYNGQPVLLVARSYSIQCSEALLTSRAGSVDIQLVTNMLFSRQVLVKFSERK